MPADHNEHTHDENVAKLGKLIKGIKFAMMVTVDTDGSLRGRPMATQETEFDGVLWFATYQSSHKTVEVEREHHINLSYADPSANTYVSVSGTATLLKDPAKAKELWNPGMKAYFPKGPDDPDLMLMKVLPDKAEYWDAPSAKVVVLAGFIKSVLTGKRPNSGEHEKIDMK